MKTFIQDSQPPGGRRSGNQTLWCSVGEEENDDWEYERGEENENMKRKEGKENGGEDEEEEGKNMKKHRKDEKKLLRKQIRLLSFHVIFILVMFIKADFLPMIWAWFHQHQDSFPFYILQQHSEKSKCSKHIVYLKLTSKNQNYPTNSILYIIVWETGRENKCMITGSYGLLHFLFSLNKYILILPKSLQ